MLLLFFHRKIWRSGDWFDGNPTSDRSNTAALLLCMSIVLLYCTVHKIMLFRSRPFASVKSKSREFVITTQSRKEEIATQRKCASA